MTWSSAVYTHSCCHNYPECNLHIIVFPSGVDLREKMAYQVRAYISQNDVQLIEEIMMLLW